MFEIIIDKYFDTDYYKKIGSNNTKIPDKYKKNIGRYGDNDLSILVIDATIIKNNNLINMINNYNTILEYTTFIVKLKKDFNFDFFIRSIHPIEYDVYSSIKEDVYYVVFQIWKN